MKQNQDIDRQLAQLVRKDLPDAPADKWFRRRVLNRLPDRRRTRIFTTAEKVSYTASFLVLCIAWILQLTAIRNSGSFTISDILICFSLFAAAVILSGSILIPVLRRS